MTCSGKEQTVAYLFYLPEMAPFELAMADERSIPPRERLWRFVYRGGSSSVIKNDVVSLAPSFIPQFS